MSESRSLTDDGSEDWTTATTGPTIREAGLLVDDSDFDAIGIGDLVSLWRDAGLRNFEALACHEVGAAVQVDVDRPLNGDRLSSLDCIDRWARVSDAGTTHRYVIEFTAPKFPPSLAARTDELFGPCDPELDEHGISMSLVGPQGAISDLVGECETAGISPDLRKIGPYDGRQRPLDTLTERQREVLRTAYEMGYYDVPRSALLEDVAAELDVGASTVNEHLQRAERNLLAQHLSDGG